MSQANKTSYEEEPYLRPAKKKQQQQHVVVPLTAYAVQVDLSFLIQKRFYEN